MSGKNGFSNSGVIKLLSTPSSTHSNYCSLCTHNLTLRNITGHTLRAPIIMLNLHHLLTKGFTNTKMAASVLLIKVPAGANWFSMHWEGLIMRNEKCSPTLMSDRHTWIWRVGTLNTFRDHSDALIASSSGGIIIRFLSFWCTPL